MVLHSNCPLCNGSGRIGFRLASDKETMVLVCDECAHVWMSPDEVDEAHAHDPLRPDFARRYPGLSLTGSRWATPEEVMGYGWAGHIAALNAVPREDSGPGVIEVITEESADDQPR